MKHAIFYFLIFAALFAFAVPAARAKGLDDFQPVVGAREWRCLGDKKTESVIDGQHAVCADVGRDDLRICKIARPGADKDDYDYFETRVTQAGRVIGRFISPDSSYTTADDFDAAFYDVDGAGRQDMIVAQQVSGGNGIEPTRYGVAVFTQTDHGFQFADHIVVSQLGDDAGFYKAGGAFYLQDGLWTYSRNIPTRYKNPGGTYWTSVWYKWQDNKFAPAPEIPVAFHRLTEGYMKRVYGAPKARCGYRAAYPWFRESGVSFYPGKNLPDDLQAMDNDPVAPVTTREAAPSCENPGARGDKPRDAWLFATCPLK